MKKIVIIGALLLSLTAFPLMGCTEKKDTVDTTGISSTVSEPSEESSAEESTGTLTETEAKNFHYKTSDDGQSVCITNYIGTEENVVIPSKIDGKPVTEIGATAFGGAKANQTILRTVYIPDTVVSIGDSAFKSCALLSEVRLPSSLKHIEKDAFANCESLKSISLSSDCLDENSSGVFYKSGLETVNLGEGVTYIPTSAFSGTKLKEVVLPSTVRYIGLGAFAFCDSLLTLKLNEGLKEIGADSIYVSAVSEITIPESVEKVSQRSLRNEALQKITFLGNAPENYAEDFFDKPGSYTIYYQPSAKGFTSPTWNGYPCYPTNSTEEMPYEAGLGYAENEQGGITILDYKGTEKNLKIPSAIHGKNVTKIGNSAFAGADLVSVEIPETVTVIEDKAFHSSTVKVVTFSPSSKLKTLGSAAFCQSEVERITLPDSLTTISSFAFAYCKSLSKIVIPSGVTLLDTQCFVFCDSLAEVTFNDGLTEIGESAFAENRALKEISIPASVKTIGVMAFSGCNHLESVKLQEGLTTIKESAFSRTKLHEITLPSTITQIDESALNNCTELTAVWFSGNAPAHYKSTDPNIRIAANYTIYYHKDASGFSSPEWEGYPTQLW